NLIPFLKSLGISDIFDPDKANLHKMSHNDELFVSKVVQKAVIKCNENGTEAAAGTALVVMDASYEEGPPPKDFTADRPFLFVLATKESLPKVMFAGAIEDPSHS